MSYFSQNVLQGCDHDSTAEHVYGDYLPMAHRFSHP